MNKVAQITNPALEGSAISGETGDTFFSTFIPKFIGWGFLIGTIAFFAMFILGAIKWTTSGGDKVKLEEAKGTLSNALIGIVLLFITFAVVKVIETFFGIDILALDIGPLKI